MGVGFFFLSRFSVCLSSTTFRTHHVQHDSNSLRVPGLLIHELFARASDGHLWVSVCEHHLPSDSLMFVDPCDCPCLINL